LHPAADIARAYRLAAHHVINLIFCVWLLSPTWQLTVTIMAFLRDFDPDMFQDRQEKTQKVTVFSIITLWIIQLQSLEAARQD
jgi:hypothetical protein